MTDAKSRRSWLRRGQSVTDSVVEGPVVQIGDVTGDVEVTVHQERARYRVEDFPFERPALSLARARNQPALLLQARYAVVDFAGRAAELARLAAWRDGDGPTSVLLLHGAGGQGKTRLAARFAQDSRELGWHVLQARHASDPSPRSARSTGTEDRGEGTLVVVDYAERWPTADLLELCADAVGRHRRARLLLIARPTGLWWQTLAGNNLDRLEIDTDHLALGPLADDVATGPHALFATAYAQFAAALDVVVDGDIPMPPDLGEDSGYREALTVHMAALAALDAHHRVGEGPFAPPLATPADVSAYLLTRERAYWESLHTHHRVRIDADAMGQSVYTAALTGPQPYAQALDAVTRVAVSTTGEPPDCIIRDHAVAYPATGGTLLEPLYPDRLAEDFLALTVPGHDLDTYTPDPWAIGAPRRLLVGGGDAEPSAWARNAMTMLIAAAERWPHLMERQLVPLLVAHPELAVQAGGAALAALSNLPGLPPDVLVDIEPHLPPGRHTDLDPGVAALTYRLAHYYLEQTQDPVVHAQLRDNLAVRLSNAGLHAEALAAAEDAMLAWRHVTRSTAGVHEPDLATSLSNLGVLLSQVGRIEEGLTLTRESISLRRRLVEDDPAAYASDLAEALNNHGVQLARVGLREDAVGFAEEATEMYRQLAGASPGVHEPALASALHNLGSVLSEVGRRDDALACAEEAAHVYRRLAAANPEVHDPDLALALNSLAVRLGKVGRREEALPAVQEAVSIRRRLARVNPAAFTADLASALENLGVRLSEVGRREEAVVPAEEAMGMYRRLATENLAAHGPAFASALNNLGVRLAEVGRREAALAAAAEAIEVYRYLAEVNPAAHEPNLASALNNLGASLAQVGRTEEALPPVQEAVDIRRRLAEAHPEVYEADLASALSNLGTRLAEVGQDEAALDCAEEATGRYQRLAEAEPAVHAVTFSSALHNLAIRLMDAGRYEEGLDAEQEAVVIRMHLAEANAAAYEPDLASSLNTFGVGLSEVGRHDDAVACIGEAVAINRRLTEANPEAYAADLALTLWSYARAQVPGGEDVWPMALEAVAEALTILGPLTLMMPGAYGGHLRGAWLTAADLLDASGSVDEAASIRAGLAQEPDDYVEVPEAVRPAPPNCSRPEKSMRRRGKRVRGN